MKSDTTLYDIYVELGLLEIMRSTEVENFIQSILIDPTWYSSLTFEVA